ncbi:MAG TPA: molybdopterin-dependent oxidoreductase, partial [Acidimicrobiales bacterium]
PGAAVETGIEVAGTNDKPLLLAGIVVLALAFGAMLGWLAIRLPRVADAGVLAFGALGGWAAARNPFSGAVQSWVASLAAALLAIGVRRVLIAVAELPPGVLPVREPRGDRGHDAPAAASAAATDDPMPGRRAFLSLCVAVGAVAAGAATIGRARRNARGVAGLRDAVVLPPAAAPPERVSGTLDGIAPRLSPYITPNDDFYRIDTALVVPQVDPAEWRLRVGGLVDRPFELTYDEILAMDLVEETVTLACVSNEVGGRLVGNARWLGVPLTTLLDRAGVRPEGTQIVGVSVDDFDAGFPTELAYDGRTALLAVGMNGEPLPIEHGFPARLVVSGLYGYVSAVKWIREIRLDTDDFDGYWIPRGWSKHGPVKTQSRIDVPRRDANLTAGRVPIAGVAWAPSVGIEAVEVRIDDEPWRLCRLGDATSDDTWVQWVTYWDATPGRHRIAVRATDKRGMVQPGERTSRAPSGAEGHHTIVVNVD